MIIVDKLPFPNFTSTFLGEGPNAGLFWKTGHCGSSRTPTDNSNYQPKDNAALAPLIAALPQVQEKGSKVGFRGLAEAALMSGHTEQYASYSGSLTTPPCSQAVHWINFLLPLHISSSQLAQFR